ncbi:hypothetical protein HWV62_9994 [Athelia sp. TMB]|nr:hypothetical protein HWV62_9994 [Athelia sp. TMB]
MGETTRAVAVYCGSSIGTQKAYQLAALCMSDRHKNWTRTLINHQNLALGQALAAFKSPLIYGGGSKGIMGIVSGAVLDNGGDVTGVIPAAMLAAGGEGDKGNGGIKSPAVDVVLNEHGREKVQSSMYAQLETLLRMNIYLISVTAQVIVGSMHERKVEMASRARGFVGLPGGYGTFEEVLEAITWTQLNIHTKPVVVLNVLNFYEPLRALVRQGVSEGFIEPQNEQLVVFVDGPSMGSAEETEWKAAQESFDWGTAAIEALDRWADDTRGIKKKFTWDWSKSVSDPMKAV